MSSSDASERTRPQSRPNARRPRRARAGFTLIEVLAAVALLGILYAVLARVAIEGLRAEGDSKRRLEASLLADERVNDLVGAAVPLVGRSQTTEGDFTFTLDVTPFAFPPEWGVADSDAATPLLLAADSKGGAQSLRTVQLTVAWLEGESERHVSRTLYLLDFQSLATLAAATAVNQGANQAQTGNQPEPPDPGDPGDEPLPEPEAP